MISEKVEKADSEQVLMLLNEVQRLLVHIRPSPHTNDSFDITAVNNDADDRPDPLRLPEVLIVICVLLLWCGSVFIFIRHSDILRIRHRDIPFRSSIKPPMNLNHITVVRRTSDMVIHSKPRISGGNAYNSQLVDYEIITLPPPPPLTTTTTTTIAAHNHFIRERAQTYSVDSNYSMSNYRHQDDQYLDPYRISSNIRRSLLDLHRKSIAKVSSIKFSMSYSTNDVSRRQLNNNVHSIIDDRCVQESPV